MNNMSFYAIITYIIIIISIYLVKPDEVYDHKKNKFKEFGLENDKTILAIPVIAVVLAILIYILFSICFIQTDVSQPTLPQFDNQHTGGYLQPPINYYYPQMLPTVMPKQ